MKCWLLVHGGDGFASGWTGEDVEEYASLSAARHGFDRFPDPYWPCADTVPQGEGGPSAWLFLWDPRGDLDELTDDVTDVYPDRIVSYGPRGGVKVDYA